MMIEKRFSLSLAVKGTILAAVAIAIVLVVHRHQLERVAGKLQAEARKAAAQGDYEVAVQELRQAAELTPHDVQIYAQIAELCQVRLRQPKEAEQWLARMIHANPEKAQAYYLRAQYWRHLGEWGAAEADIHKALEIAPDHQDAMLLLTECSAEQQQYDLARQLGKAAVDLNPKYSGAYLRLADVEIRDGHREQAIELLRHASLKIPGDSQILWKLANLYLDDGKLLYAQPIIDALQKSSLEAYLKTYLRGRVEYLQRQWLVAAQSFESIRDVLASSPQLAKRGEYWTAICYGRTGNLEAQLLACRRALAFDEDWIPARAAVASALLRAGQFAEAAGELRTLAKLPGAPPATWRELGRALIMMNLCLSPSEQSWDEAEMALRHADKQPSTSGSVALLWAEMFAARQRPEDAERVLREAWEKHPEDLMLWIGLANWADERGDAPQAAELLDEAQRRLGDQAVLRLARAERRLRSQQDGDHSWLAELAEGTQTYSAQDRLVLWRGLADIAFRAGDLKLARTLYSKVSRQSPDDLQVELRLFDMAIGEKDTAALEGILKEIQRLEGGGALWNYGRAAYLRLLATQRGGVEDLSQLAEAHLDKVHDYRPLWARVPMFDADGGQFDTYAEKTIQTYMQAIGMGDRSPALIRRLVQLLFERQRYREAERVLRRCGREENGFPPGLDRLAAEVALQLGDTRKAVSIAARAALDSQNYRDHVWQAQILSLAALKAESEQRSDERQRWLREAEKSLREATRVAPETVAVWVALVQLLASGQRLEEARQVMTEMQDRIPAIQRALAMARCCEALGETGEAEARFREALNASPGDAAAMGRAAVFYQRAGKAAAAEALLRRMRTTLAGERSASAVWARRRLAGLLSARGRDADVREALQLVEENLKLTGNALEDIRAKALLCRVHPEKDCRADALPMLERLVQMQSLPPASDLFALAQACYAASQPKRGNAVMERLLEGQERDPRHVAAYVRALLDQEDVVSARSWLTRLDRLAPNDFSAVELQTEYLVRTQKVGKAVQLLRDYLDAREAPRSERRQRLESVAHCLWRMAARIEKLDRVAAAELRNAAEQVWGVGKLDREEQALHAAFLAETGRVGKALEVAGQVGPGMSLASLTRLVAATLEDGRVTETDLEKASAFLQASLPAHGRPTVLLKLGATLAARLGECDQAEQLLREVLQKDAQDLMALNNLAAQLALQRSNLEEALRLAEAAINLGGATSTHLDSRALVYLAMGRLDEANRDLDAAIAVAPNGLYYFHKAQVLLSLDRKPEAKTAWGRSRLLGLQTHQLHPLERPVYEQTEQKLRQVMGGSGEG